MVKHIFITGGVVSSLGKGLTAASIALLLKRRGLNVQIQKLDPYINISTPTQHGEVYLLDDGTYADRDIGHYERFTGIALTGNNSWTTGQIYRNVAQREQKGEYGGDIIQVVPHITDEIKRLIFCLAAQNTDVVITEIGGTVGDIESLPFLEAIRQIPLEVGKQNCLFIHLSLIPFLKAAKEIKTKPTQHSVGQLRQIGIQPDILICRTEVGLNSEERAKIGLFCNIEADSVIEEKDKEVSIYEVPLRLRDKQLDKLILKKLGVAPSCAASFSDWEELLRRINNPERELTAALIGEFAAQPNVYESIEEALEHAGIYFRTKINLRRFPGSTADRLNGVDAVVAVGENPDIAEIALKQAIPYLAVGALQKDTVNSGADAVIFVPNSKIGEVYSGQQFAVERFFSSNRGVPHSDRPVAVLPAADLKPCATSPDGSRITAMELPGHPFYFMVQYRPEFKSQPLKPHPLFRGLIQAAIERRK